MQEVALYVHTINNAPELAEIPPMKRWTPERMAQLRKLQAVYSLIARRIQEHPDGHVVEVRDGPVVGQAVQQ